MQKTHTWCVRVVHNLENCMKESPRSADGEGRSRLSRRTLFAGATTVGRAGRCRHRAAARRIATAAAAEPKAAPKRGGGYSVSEHVKHYYQTTRI